MSPRKHWIRASAASALLGSAMLAVTASAQDEPTAPPDTTGDQAARTQRECRQMTGEERQKCERDLTAPAEQTDPNSINSTTRSAPASSNPNRSADRLPPSPPTQDKTPGPSSSTDQAHSSSGKREQASDASGDRTRLSRKDADSKEPAERNRSRTPDEEEDESTTESTPPASDSSTPPPDVQSESNTETDTADPPPPQA